ncbi:MAG: hypothetical protein Q8K93_30085 [Reyranella sp.]|uniref:hypothetical protein n=1 Tax=Reyranella sp. TaxID=1929291 RepID=UPI0027307D6A|nr:hypothetical protein [Reyranella sp.]MDP1966440.1 hypothetical protein [Reyranella sp.]MDP2375843.1 hypothetical protein [Reyranella sp.]
MYEIKLDDEFLMSSLFTVAEIALARLGLAGSPGKDIDVRRRERKLITGAAVA